MEIEKKMKLPNGWPNVKLPEGWPDPKFHPRPVEAAQDPLYRNKAISVEDTLRKKLEKSNIGAVIQLSYIDSPYLKYKIARRYRRRLERNS